MSEAAVVELETAEALFTEARATSLLSLTSSVRGALQRRASVRQSA